MFILYTILANILSSLIEAIRIKITYGKVENLNKVVSFLIGATLFGFCLALIYNNYYDTPSFIEIVIYSLFYASIRGLFYDPFLNLFRGKKIDYTSSTTNSIIDQIEKLDFDFTFWHERFFYLISSIITGLLYQLF
jgi:hypothetical protein